jgi:hypothetical protein
MEGIVEEDVPRACRLCEIRWWAGRPIFWVPPDVLTRALPNGKTSNWDDPRNGADTANDYKVAFHTASRWQIFQR